MATALHTLLTRLLALVALAMLVMAPSAIADDKGVGVEAIDAARQLGANRRALLIGINDYADGGVKDLSFAESDARVLYETLTDPRVGGFAKSDITLLLGKDATTKNIRKALYALRSCAKDDLIVIFFSGHGAKQGGETFWISQDAELADLGPTALPNAEIQRLLSAIPSERVVTLLDCCYAADTVLNQKSVLNIADVAKLFTGKGRVTIAGAGGGDEAIEVPGMKQGVFTHFLVDGLRGMADSNRDGVVTLMELWGYLEPNVEQSARQHKGIQKPTMHMETGQQTDRFLLTLNPVAAADVQAGLASLRKLFIDEKISSVQYEEGRKLLDRVAADPDQKKRREVFLDLAAGKLDAKYLASALAALSPSRPRESPARIDTPPEEGAGASPKELTLDLGGGVKMELVLIPAGEFMMGSPDGEEERFSDEGPQHRVRIAQPFYMGKYEVTQAQWTAVMGENPSHFKDCGGNCPVEQVSWEDCQSFCKKLSSRTGKKVQLPSEAQWEYACRAGSTGSYCFGDSDSSLGGYAWYDENSDDKTHSVGDKQANAWGLYDVHGNVLEWCEDWYHEDYSGAPTNGSAWLSGGKQESRVLRGGSWNGLHRRRNLRSAVRSRGGPVNRYTRVGLRVGASLGT